MRKMRVMEWLNRRSNANRGDVNAGGGDTGGRDNSAGDRDNAARDTQGREPGDKRAGAGILSIARDPSCVSDARLQEWLASTADLAPTANSYSAAVGDVGTHGVAGGRAATDSGIFRRAVPVTGLLQHYTIRGKLLFGIVMLVVTIIALTTVGLIGLYRYRALADAISSRATELPLATELSQWAASARDSNTRICQMKAREGMIDSSVLSVSGRQFELLQLDQAILELNVAYSRYGAAIGVTYLVDAGNVPEQNAAIESDDLASTLIDTNKQRHSLVSIGKTIRELDRLRQNPRAHAICQQTGTNEMSEICNQLVTDCSDHLDLIHSQMAQFSDHVRSQHRYGIACAWTAFIFASCVTVAMVIYFQLVVIGPFNNLVSGARLVAEGKYDNTIDLGSEDEIGELAGILNDMTVRFRLSTMRNEKLMQQQDEEIKIRSREVIRNEQLASVGFLAAGFAHEINNPMASIAWSAEALESRVSDLQMLPPEQRLIDEEMMESLHEYLQRIEGEAYRCQSITERMLSFSRVGQVEREMIDLVPLVNDVIDLVRTLGKYKCQNVTVTGKEVLNAYASSQEIRQVVLNLMTNAMESVDEDGQVTVVLQEDGEFASIQVRDTGCGMTNEVIQHLFEPFYTRRRDGSGTGLGLSISNRIVCQHGGQLIPRSPGPGQGSEMELRLPVSPIDVMPQQPVSHQPVPKEYQIPWRETSTPQAA